MNTLRIRVYGIVQGVGFRPTVSRHAAASGVNGYVCNKGPYVEILAQGSTEETDHFLELLKKEPPKRAAILKIDVHQEEKEGTAYHQFEIVESEKTSGEIFISPDIAICEDCKHELFDPKNRRYLHPFINCTCCGPRLTILDALPYDRERTSMKKFPMCPDCEQEYYSPSTRRYDAQPVCCPDCGPEVYLLGREERGREAILTARRCIAEGGIIAVKGIGGFHLCCDATNEQAVERLRTLKNRPMKPFAVMMRDVDVVHRECEITPELEEILTGHQKPILLLKRKTGGKVSDNCAPENTKLGVMLPYAPIQLLLFQYDDGLPMTDCFVMTSGNESGAPICRDDEEAKESLSHLCDMILSNDRDIRVRADDTVMDIFEGQPYMIRRSRGYAPLPFMVTEQKENGRCVLGIGGELKNSFTLKTGALYYPSPYIGDLADIRTVRALKETLRRMETLLEVKPEVVACDLHPLYHSVEVAQELELPMIQLQHHYAHILSCMAENDYLDPVIGVSFDGTGYGTDGTIWGGEILLADTHGFSRVASVSPFLQIGGDVSAKEGWRIAVSMISDRFDDLEKAWKLAERLELCDRQTFQIQYRMVKRRLNAVESTSAGRIFDAVSAILGIRRSSSFEGEASISLQYYAEKYLESNGYQTCQSQDLKALKLIKQTEQKAEEESADTRRFLLGTEDLVNWIMEQRLNGEEVSYLAYVFHEKLAEMIGKACARIRAYANRNVVSLSGGVFQNTLLLGMCKKILESNGFQVIIHHMIPPNDGGISIGQALYAACNLEEIKES